MRSEQEIRNEIERLKRVYSKAKCKYEEVINTLLFNENETDKELEKSVSLAINKIAEQKGL